MAFSKEIYAELEQAVGAENVSQEPCVLETYRCATHQSSCHYGPYVSRTPMPQAVVLPETTEEVQKVVKICNKYGIKFKASTTLPNTNREVLMAPLSFSLRPLLPVRRLSSEPAKSIK